MTSGQLAVVQEEKDQEWKEEEEGGEGGGTELGWRQESTTDMARREQHTAGRAAGEGAAQEVYLLLLEYAMSKAVEGEVRIQRERRRQEEEEEVAGGPEEAVALASAASPPRTEETRGASPLDKWTSGWSQLPRCCHRLPRALVAERRREGAQGGAPLLASSTSLLLRGADNTPSRAGGRGARGSEDGVAKRGWRGGAGSAGGAARSRLRELNTKMEAAGPGGMAPGEVQVRRRMMMTSSRRLFVRSRPSAAV